MAKWNRKNVALRKNSDEVGRSDRVVVRISPRQLLEAHGCASSAEARSAHRRDCSETVFF